MEDKWLLAFDSTQQALRAEMLLEYLDLDIEVCPTPKAITAGCALAIEFDQADLDVVRNVIREEQVAIRGIYFKKDGKYDTIEERNEER